jgi:DNA-binding CsgD family transcriptional regulator
MHRILVLSILFLTISVKFSQTNDIHTLNLKEYIPNLEQLNTEAKFKALDSLEKALFTEDKFQEHIPVANHILSVYFNQLSYESELIIKFRISKAYYKLGRYSDALDVSYKLSLLDLSEHSNVKSWTHGILADCLDKLGSKALAIEHYHIAFKFHNVSLQSVHSYYVMQNMALLQYNYNSVDSAIYYSNIADTIASNLQDTTLLIHAKNNTGYFYEKIDKKTSLALYNQSLNLLNHKSVLNKQDSILLGTIYGNIGNLELHFGNTQEGFELIQKNKNLYQLLLTKSDYFNGLVDLLEILGKNEANEHASSYIIELESLKAKIRSSLTNQKLAQYYDVAALVYFNNGDFKHAALAKDSAYHFLSLHDKTIQSNLVDVTNSEIQFRMLDAKKSLKLAEVKADQLLTENQTIQNEKQLEQERKTRILQLSLMLFVFLGIVIQRQFVIRKKQKKIYKMKKAVFQQELESTNLKLERSRMELSNFTQTIMDKNKVIDSLLEKMDSYKLSSVEKEKSKNELLSRKILTTEDWAKFKSLFSQQFESFHNHVRTNYPKLTESELRMLMLLKLNHSSNEISDILGISVSSVMTTRYRLRKKIGLPSGQNLKEFIATID